MKKKIFWSLIITLIITSGAFFAKSQTSSTIDFLFLNQFDLSIAGTPASSINTILLGESAFLQKFGSPASSSTEYSEEEEGNMTHYAYNGADIWYMNDALQSMNITSPNYSFQLSNGSSIKVGDNINLVSSIFPGFMDP